jgi:hypothetical protein
MYSEDIDLSRRLATRFETAFSPDVSAVHDCGAGSHKSRRMFWFTRLILLIILINRGGYFTKKEIF